SKPSARHFAETDGRSNREPVFPRTLSARGFHLPNLDPTAVLQVRTSPGEFDSFVIAARIDSKGPADDLLCLGERAISHTKLAAETVEMLAAFIAELLAANQFALTANLLRPRNILRDHSLNCIGREL